MDTQKHNFQRVAQIQSVERAIWILKCFEQHDLLSLSDISRMMQLHKSTTFGLVSTLSAYQLLEQDPETGKYRLGIELFRLGNKVNIDLRSLVAPYLNRLMDICNETVNFVIPDGEYILYMEKKECSRSMRISTTIGHREPLYRTAAGKAILAKLPHETAVSLLQKTTFEQSTHNTLKNADEVLEELQIIQQKGYAIDNEELEYGLICLGVAITNYAGIPVGAISISGSSARMTKENIDLFSGYLIDYGKQISSRL